MKERRKLDININLNVRGLKPSATLAINERSADITKQGGVVYRLGLGQSPFPVPSEVVQELKRNAFQKDYIAVKGLRQLRDAVADYVLRKQNVKRTGDDVLIGPGSKELMFILQLVYYGDIIIPTPAWVSYAPQGNIIGRQVRWVQTKEENDWRLFPEELEDLCRDDPSRPRLLIFNYPNNPTGITYGLERLKKLAQVARQYRVLLLSDEIYGELHHKGQHVSISRFYPEGTIISGGLSKWCGAGGWRLGSCVFPEQLRWLLDAMAIVASETFTSTSAPIQYAAVKAYDGSDEIDDYLRHSRRILSALGRCLAKKLNKAGIKTLKPGGGFYLFPDFSPHAEKLAGRGITASCELCERILTETGVALLPGSDFGRVPEELTARLAYVDFDGKRVLKASAEIPWDTAINEDFLKKHCKRVIKAVELICDWINRGDS